MALFDSVADDYRRFRPGVPDEVVQLLAGTLAGVVEPTVVDLGAGTGQVALALLPVLPPVARLDLVDQDDGMLSAAMDALRPHIGERTVVPHTVRAEEFAPAPPDYRADLVTCCRALHWMDRPAVLAMADRVTTRTGVIALMGDGSLWTHQADWTAALKELIQTHLGEGRRAGTTGAYSGPGRRYEDDLAHSAFGDVTEERFPLTRTWTPAGVIGYLRSTSFARPDLFFDHARFEEQALELLEEHAQGGLLSEESVFTVLLARRPKAVR